MDEYVKNLFATCAVMLLLGIILCSPAAALITGSVDADGVPVTDSQRKGDYNQMVEERIIRFLMPFSKTFFYLDGATQRGLSYDTARRFETFVNDHLKKGHLKVHVVIIPTERSKLFSFVTEGYGDIAVGNLTITDGRRQQVDFSDPFLKNVEEVVVTRKDVPELKDRKSVV